jgi:predicted ATPase
MTESLLRFVQEHQVRYRFNRLAHKDSILTRFYFEYAIPCSGNNGIAPTISFSVVPESYPPTNVHVLIGANGVGKTRCMKRLALAISNEIEAPNENGFISTGADDKGHLSFTGLIVVSFSAFDSFNIPAKTKPGIRAERVGLPDVEFFERENIYVVKKPNTLQERLADLFCTSMQKCRKGLRLERLRAAIETLENDPLFAEAEVMTLLNLSDKEWKSAVRNQFLNLSSGHAIVLLTISRLVELVEEQTIVLIDEPEEHLHPPLLSTFIRALSDLLIKRNAVAIITTHSPVVLQEIPKSCVWVLRRSGNVAVAERPSIETFGENVGTLTREIFGLEVTKSGFHKMLKTAVNDKSLTYDSIVDMFQGQLGAEAHGIIRSLIAIRDKENWP